MLSKSARKKEGKGESTKTQILRGFSFFFLIIAIVSGFLFVREYQAYRTGVNAYDTIAEAVIVQGESLATTGQEAQNGDQNQIIAKSGDQKGEISGTSTSKLSTLPSEDQLDYKRIRKLLSINFDRLTGINPDAVGWILSENTRINYPLVQGRDNYYYLNRLVNNEVNKLGSIFMDYHNKRDFSDAHTLIYGHNMKDGSMFNDLELYKDPSYYDDHRSIYILTKDQVFRVEVIAGYLTTPQKIGQIYFNFDTPEIRDNYISEARRLSNFKSEVVISGEDRIVSFFTCDYATEDSRYVVIGKLVPLNP